MKYLILDVETGGLEPGRHSLLEVGMVHRQGEEGLDTARVVFLHTDLVMNLFCVNMHRELLFEMSKVEESGWWADLILDDFTYGCVKPGEPESLSPYLTYYSMAGENASQAFQAALIELGVCIEDGARTVVGGKNVAGFDLPFLHAAGLMEMAPNGLQLKVHRRTLDPALGLMLPTDDVPPDLNECLLRASIPAQAGAHTGMVDALAVDALIKRQILLNEATLP